MVTQTSQFNLKTGEMLHYVEDDNTSISASLSKSFWICFDVLLNWYLYFVISVFSNAWGRQGTIHNLWGANNPWDPRGLRSDSPEGSFGCFSSQLTFFSQNRCHHRGASSLNSTTSLGIKVFFILLLLYLKYDSILWLALLSWIVIGFWKGLG